MSIFAYLILALIVGVGGFFVVFATRLFIRLSGPARWPKTMGQVVTSNVETQDSGPSNDVTSKTIRTVPRIVYHYQVHGKSYECDCIKLGRSWAAHHQIPAIFLRYPVGATVEVRYDPADPGNAVIEFDSGFRLLYGFLLTIFLLLLMGMFFYYFFFGLPKGISKGVTATVSGVVSNAHEAVTSRIIHHFPHAKAGLVIEAGGLGAVLTIVGLVCLWRVLVKRSWPVTRGRIISSQVEFADTDAPYLPDVIYEYKVNNKHFKSNRISSSPMASNRPRHAQKVARRYPQGSMIEVRYNPENHSESVVETGGVGAMIFLPVGGAFLWIAVAALG